MGYIKNKEMIQEKTIVHSNDELSYLSNVSTGDKDYLYPKLRESIKNAESIDIIVSFIMMSGVNQIIEDLRASIDRNVRVRILTGSYLNITQPSALYKLKSEFKNKIELKFYDNNNVSFHPKAYFFHSKNKNELYVGSSNLSRGALTSSIEWNYRFLESDSPMDYKKFYDTFEDLYNNHSIEITDEVLKQYSRSWKKPKLFQDLKRFGFDDEEENNIVNLYEPRDAQIEALYNLEKTREEGFDKGIIVAATGIGKTYLAAFDSKEYNRVLFVAHREEILDQAARSFKNIRNSDDYGFFKGDMKDSTKSVVFALVQTLGKKEYLNDEYFKKDYFDYIVIDEFHHAVSSNYKNIIDYFTPNFLLGITATPDRLDNKDVFALCDYNSVYEIRLKEAIDKGYLCPFRYYGIYDDTVNYEKIDYKNGRYDNDQLNKSLMINKRAELIMNHYRKYNSKRCLGFCTSKLHAEYMAEYFSNHGVCSRAVYSGQQGKYSMNRNDAISSLKNGDIKVLFSVDMFNEGLDIPSIDTILFLRPTESPTIFLQQLGRGLRKSNNKDFVNVLDFIGNYKKANLIPFLLSSKDYSASKSKSNIHQDYIEPEDCRIEFDFRLIELFKQQAEREMTIKDKIRAEYFRIKEYIGHRPSRLELLIYMDDYIYLNLRKVKKEMNPFSNYLKFLNDNGELLEDEKTLLNTRAEDFINMIETTSMSKTYKMPILLAFYNDGNLKKELNEDDIYKAMYQFYKIGSNKVDMLRDNSSSDFESWDKSKYINLAVKNPIKFLLKTHGNFFIKTDNSMISLYDDIENFKNNEFFMENMKDAIDFRVKSYYKSRFENRRDN